MPNPAAGLGTSTAALAQMRSVEQLQYVEQYFMERAGAGNGNLSTLEGVYTSVLYGSPKSDPNSTLWSSGSIEYKWNSGLDRTGDGRVTAGAPSAAVRGGVAGNIDADGQTVPGREHVAEGKRVAVGVGQRGGLNIKTQKKRLIE